MNIQHPEFEKLSSKEWLITNGIGGYASSSLCGANTRRYHGLLVASFHPPTDRRVLVSKVEEKVVADGKEFYLSSNAYPGAIHPKGYQYLASFQRMPFPQSVFAFEKSELTKSVFMRYGLNTTVISYKNTGKESFAMELTPLLIHRDYHQLFHQDKSWTFDLTTVEPGLIKVNPGRNCPAVFIRFPNGIFFPNQDWYRNFEYIRETERGLYDHEDAFCIGTIKVELSPGETTYLLCSTAAEDLKGDPHLWKKEEEKRIKSLSPKWKNAFLHDLAVSGDQFLVHRQSSSSYTLIAGYHWFTDWGRDTMIAMRGLIITTGKKDEAKSILKTFLHYLDGGMIPNRFPDQGEKPEYNTMDATLWLFVALYEYHQKFKDLDFISEVFDSLTIIIDAHIKGTKYNIHVTPEGLLSGGRDGTQLTWMDAKVENYVVTPRIGCPVEINALWYNALCIYAKFGKLLEIDIKSFAKKAKEFKQVFRSYFLNEKGYLNDVVIAGVMTDEAIRPNQVYAISLPFSPLSDDEGKKVMGVIKKHLYTDYGLRSLSPDDPNFKPVYTGDQWRRDNAYHQGTVWAYLWGEYAIAHLNIHQYSEEARHWVKKHVKKLEHHFYHEDALHAISEVFDGEKPIMGKGCIQQAWSIGMTLKALVMAET